jgi:hypothetical protein
MTEAEWLACMDPQKLLEFLRGKVSERKLRLYACACCRRIERLMPDEPGRRAVEVAERYADQQASREELKQARKCLGLSPAYFAASGGSKTTHHFAEAARHAVYRAGSCAAYQAGSDPSLAARDARRAVAQTAEQTEQLALLRCVFGNRFRPVSRSPVWRTPDVLKLAQAAYEDRILPAGTLDPDRLAVLADALEEAGCDSADILSHLRGPGPHVRGCWVVDLLLGKE